MKRLTSRKKAIFKRIAAVMMAGVFMFSMPCGTIKTHATEATGTTNTTGTETVTTGTTTTTNVNTDPNGKLGKNSDVGLELAESITGVIGKKVTIAYTLKSVNVNTIKIKGVYPVIDTSFPFETSGDAYKVISAGEDVNLQQNLPASFELKSRSDLSVGYQSIRFIAEYSKLSATGEFEDFYVIKTINIYFSNTTTDNSGNKNSDKDKNNSGGNSSDKNSSDKNSSGGSSSKDDDDDDDSSSGGGGYYGGGGSSSDDEAVAPKLVITGFDTKPEKIMAGDTFTITIHIQNTSKSVSLCNGKFLVGNEAGAFLPTSGSSAVYIEKIEPDSTGDLVMEMKTSPDLAQNNYMLVVKGDFDDGKGNNFTSSDNLTVSVYQKVKLTVSDVSMSPEKLPVGSTGSLMFTINNPGSAGVNNVNVSIKDENVEGPDSFVGNIAGNSSAYATLSVTGINDNSETGTITVEISYEDSEGEKGTLEQTLACVVGESFEVSDEDVYEYDDLYEEDEDEGLPTWLIIVIIVLVVAAVVGLIVFLILRKKKRMAALMADDDEDGEEYLDNEDF